MTWIDLDNCDSNKLGITTYEDWVGKDAEFTCPHCKGQAVLPSYHYCPRCGDGLRPIACEHFIPDPFAVPSPDIIEPVIEVGMDDDGLEYALVKCATCNKTTSKRRRLKLALEAWNKCEWDMVKQTGP